MRITPESPRPLYQQVKEHILEKIGSGEWAPDTRIPSEKELVDRLNVSRMTVNRALRELSESEKLVRIQGVGTYVARPKPVTTLFEIRSIDDEIREWGGVYACSVELLAEENAFPELASAMEIPVSTPVFHCIILHKNSGTPAMLEDRYVNPETAPEFLDQDFRCITPSRYLLGVTPATDVEHIIEAAIPGDQVRDLLAVGPEEPILNLHRQTWSNETVVTHTRMTYPGSAYRIGGRFKPVFSPDHDIPRRTQ